MQNEHKFIGAKILNISKACILIRQLNNGVFTIPIMPIRSEDNPLTYFNNIMDQVLGSYKLVSAANVISTKHAYTFENVGNECINTVYSIKYSGVIYSDIPEKCSDQYARGLWMPINDFIGNKQLNKTSAALAMIMEKELEESCKKAKRYII